MPLTESKTQWLQDLQLTNQVRSAWSEPHANSFDHSLNIITEVTDSAVFANIICSIQGRSLTPAPVEPQLHLLVKHRQSPLCSSTGKTQMKAADHGLTIRLTQPIGELFRTDLHQVHKKGLRVYLQSTFHLNTSSFHLWPKQWRCQYDGCFFKNSSSFHLHLDRGCIFHCQRSYTVPRSEVKDRLFSHSHTTPSIIQRSAAILQVQDFSEMA